MRRALRTKHITAAIFAVALQSAAAAGEATGTYRFPRSPLHEMHLSISDDRKISGQILAVADKSKLATIEGENTHPGRITITVQSDDTALARTNVVFQQRKARKTEVESLGEEESFTLVWTSGGPGDWFSVFASCYSSCKTKPRPEVTGPQDNDNETGEATEFEFVAAWQVGWDINRPGYVELATKPSVLPTALAVLRRSIRPATSIRIGDEGTPRIGVYRIYVPSGLEDEAVAILKRQKGVQRVTRGYHMRDSEVLTAAFRAGTILSQKPSRAAMPDLVQQVRGLLRQQFERLNVAPVVSQSREGGLSFIVEFTGYSDAQMPNGGRLLAEVPGVWLKSRAQFRISTRDEPNTPSGYVDVVETHVIQTKVFRAPAAYRVLGTETFLAVERYDSTLDSFTVDTALVSNIADAISTQLNGSIIHTD